MTYLSMMAKTPAPATPADLLERAIVHYMATHPGATASDFARDILVRTPRTLRRWREQARIDPTDVPDLVQDKCRKVLGIKEGSPNGRA
jgi:hypothetical protein